jgi:hypothetical protein
MRASATSGETSLGLAGVTRVWSRLGIGEECFHDHWCSRDDEASDYRQLARIGVATANGEASTHDTNRAEDEADEHDDAHRFARAFGEAAGGLSENESELV